jgi:putative transposase
LGNTKTSTVTLYREKYRAETTRLRDWDYRTPAWYFVTICASNHACIFVTASEGNVRLSAAGKIADSELQSLAAHYSDVALDSFVVMPNHLHFILVLDGCRRFSPNTKVPVAPAMTHIQGLVSPMAGSLSTIVRSYKAGVTRRCHDLGLPNFAWQPGFYEHVLRGNASVDAVRGYIARNPANWLKDLENSGNR